MNPVSPKFSGMFHNVYYTKANMAAIRATAEMTEKEYPVRVLLSPPREMGEAKATGGDIVICAKDHNFFADEKDPYQNGLRVPNADTFFATLLALHGFGGHPGQHLDPNWVPNAYFLKSAGYAPAVELIEKAPDESTSPADSATSSTENADSDDSKPPTPGA